MFQPSMATRVNVIGIQGQGKSVWRNAYLQHIYRCTVWNPLGDYNVGEVITVTEYRKRLESFRRGVLRITVEPTSFGKEQMVEEFDELCQLVEEVGAQHFAVEEIGLVCSPVAVPPNFARLCIRGRHRAISLSLYGQRFHQFPLIARGTSTELIAFRQVEPDDVNDFDRRIAPHDSPIALNELPDFHFLHWTAEGGPMYCSPLPFKGEDDASSQSRTHVSVGDRGNDGHSLQNSGD